MVIMDGEEGKIINHTFVPFNEIYLKNRKVAFCVQIFKATFIFLYVIFMIFFISSFITPVNANEEVYPISSVGINLSDNSQYDISSLINGGDAFFLHGDDTAYIMEFSDTVSITKTDINTGTLYDESFEYFVSNDSNCMIEPLNSDIIYVTPDFIHSWHEDHQETAYFYSGCGEYKYFGIILHNPTISHAAYLYHLYYYTGIQEEQTLVPTPTPTPDDYDPLPIIAERGTNYIKYSWPDIYVDPLFDGVTEMYKDGEQIYNYRLYSNSTIQINLEPNTLHSFEIYTIQGLHAYKEVKTLPIEKTSQDKIADFALDYLLMIVIICLLIVGIRIPLVAVVGAVFSIIGLLDSLTKGFLNVIIFVVLFVATSYVFYEGAR